MRSFLEIRVLLRSPKLCKINLEKQNKLPQVFWLPPPRASFKFNIDASVVGSYGEADISGILSDYEGTPLIKFSKSIGLSDPTGADLEAIREARLIFLVSKWRDSCSLIIESDSILAVNWINSLSQVPLGFAGTVQ
ncbi:hypothetical protein V6N13_080821 [Hibiscus sabdariffa]